MSSTSPSDALTSKNHLADTLEHVASHNCGRYVAGVPAEYLSLDVLLYAASRALRAAPETGEERQRLIDEARILFPHCGDPPNETKAPRCWWPECKETTGDAVVNACERALSEKTNDGLPPFYTERKCSQCGATEERIQREGCPEKCGRTAGDVSGDA